MLTESTPSKRFPIADLAPVIILTLLIVAALFAFLLLGTCPICSDIACH